MVTQIYHTDPHTRVYLAYLAEMERREREREERKRQEEAGGGGLGAGIGAGVGAIAGTLIAPGIGTAIGAQVGGQAGGAIGTAIDPPGGPVGAARNQAWQQGIGAVTDLGVTAATWRDLQAPHEAPGTAPSFMETYAAQQGRGGLGGLYQERRRAERQMGLLQERDRARQQYLDSMRGIGFKPVPSGRGIQARFDEFDAILRNEGNLTPAQQDQALSIAIQKPIPTILRRVEPTPEERHQKSSYFDPKIGERFTFTDRGGEKQITDNAGNRLKQQKQDADETDDKTKHSIEAYKQAELMLPKEATPQQIERKAGQILDIAERLASGERLPAEDRVGIKRDIIPTPQAKGMGWMDRAKLGMDIARSMRAGAPQGGPQQPGQQAPPGPDQLLAQLDAMLEAESDVSKWPAEQKAQAQQMLEVVLGAFVEAKAAQGGKLDDPQKAIVRRLIKLDKEL